MSLHDVILLLLGMSLGMAAAVGLLGAFAMVDRVTMRTPPSDIPHDAEPRPDFVPEVFPEPAIDRAPSAPDDIPVLDAPMTALAPHAVNTPSAELQPVVPADEPAPSNGAVEPLPEPVTGSAERITAEAARTGPPSPAQEKRSSVEDLFADAFRKARTPSGPDAP